MAGFDSKDRRENPASAEVSRRHASQRDFFVFLAGGAANAPLQNLPTCLVPSVIKVAACRFAWAFATPRAEPIIALAPLNHMLRNGFFFVHGFFIVVSWLLTFM